ncbi:MAG TPA: alpha/beta fold hydrolase [Allosphingosinicella sp.]|jgi:pimeloyl-ACP methyl ester carboxylesterase
MLATMLAAAAAASVPFAVPSVTDGRAIHGQIDIPASPPKGVVVLVPGTGDHSRDLRLNSNPKEAPVLVFQDLARRLNRAGLAVARFDKRGFSCVKQGKTGSDGWGCHDAEETPTVTWATSAGDVEAVVRHAEAQPGGDCLVLVGHSEGTVHIARLIEGERVRPAGFIGLGPVMDSFASLLHDQAVERLTDGLLAMDKDRDGVTSRTEFLSQLPGSRLAADFDSNGECTAFCLAELEKRSPVGPAGITALEVRALRDRLQALYRRKVEAQAGPAAPPLYAFPDGTVYSTTDWRRQVLTEWVPSALRLSRYRGPVVLYWGTADRQVNLAQGLAAVRRFGPAQAVNRVYEGLGHMLGTHAVAGPIREDVAQSIVADAERMAASCAKERAAR